MPAAPASTYPILMQLGMGGRGGEGAAMRLAERQIRVSWQIVPVVLAEMLQDKNADKSERVRHSAGLGY
jgi:hypothetical protein